MNEFRTEYDRFFAWAMQILHSSGELSAVQEYISTIEDRDYGDATFCKVAVALAAQNRSDEGMLFIQAIEQPMERADALLGVAREHAKRGERLEAKASLMEATTAAESVEHSTWEAPSILLQVSAELHGLE